MTDSQKTKGTKKSKDFDQDAFFQILMNISAQKGWKNTQMSDVCAALGIEIDNLPQNLQNKQTALVAFNAFISKKVKENIGDWFADESIRDRLFDVFMERFEAMQPYKNGLRNVFYTLIKNPKFSFLSKKHLRITIKDMYLLAGGHIRCPKDETKLLGLSLVYLKTIHTWLKDDTKDLSITMAELDKNLNFAEQLATSLKLIA